MDAPDRTVRTEPKTKKVKISKTKT